MRAMGKGRPATHEDHAVPGASERPEARQPPGLVERLLQLRLPWEAPRTRGRVADRRSVSIGGREFPVDVRRHRWARRYLVRLTEDGRVVLTVPPRASVAGGLAFVHAETAWIDREWRRLGARLTWEAGTEVWWRGERVSLAIVPGQIVCGSEIIPAAGADVRATVTRHWRSVAEQALPPRCFALGTHVGLVPARVSVRDQRSRWGACSSRRAITLNWRLIQMSPFVSDYVILHELAHLEQPNHSRRFWRKVAEICPGWRDAERWLRTHGRELL
jgi:predicted metal-dependent hydrolase